MDKRTLAVMAEWLELRGRHPLFARAIAEYMDHLALAGPAAILDLGCGTGVAARAITRRPEVEGPVTAIDISPHLVDAAKRLAEAQGLGGRIGFRVGNAHRLGLPEGAFDVVVMHTLVSHVADPAAVLAEGGFGLLWSRAYVAADIGRVDFWAPGVVPFRALLPKAGAMPEAEADAIADGLERASAENRFFGAGNYYAYVARRAE